MGRPKKRQRQEEEPEQNGQRVPQHTAPTLTRQESLFDFHVQGQHSTPSESQAANFSENLSTGPFGDNDTLFGAFGPPIDQIDPSLDSKYVSNHLESSLLPCLTVVTPVLCL